MERQHIASLAVAILLSACAASPLQPEDRAALDARQPAEARLGALVRLYDWPPIRVTGLVSPDGRAHVFAIDPKRGLEHVEIDGNGIVARESLAVLKEDPAKIQLDSIEWPPGSLRVIAGSSQFVRSGAGMAWQEMKANRCTRFLAVADRLFCPFVMSGEALGAPKRMDFYGGLIVLVPYLIPVEKQSRKLVVAEAVADAWVIRAVVDADDPLDALGFFAIGADAEGDVHVVYEVGKGGALLILFPAGQGGIYEEPERKIRYARIRREALRLPAGVTPEAAAAPLALANGSNVPGPAWMESEVKWDLRARRLLSALAVSPTSGAVEGLAPANQAVIDRRGKTVTFSGAMGVELRDGRWQEPATVVVANDWPEHGLDYGFVVPALRPSVRFDPTGTLHALVPLCTNHPVWEPCRPAFGYLVKREGRWSRPLMFTTGVDSGRPAVDHAQEHSLLIAGEGRVFVGWIENAVFNGRWLLPSSHAADKTEGHSN